ncbi:MAG: hypothetical protein AAFX08_09250 [Pseudomonadota bacterium]
MRRRSPSRIVRTHGPCPFPSGAIAERWAELDGMTAVQVAQIVPRDKFAEARDMGAIELHDTRTQRACMCCGRSFMSAGIGNRLCRNCKDTLA